MSFFGETAFDIEFSQGPAAGHYSVTNQDPSPVSLQSVKSYMRITSDCDDDLIQSLIRAATSEVEIALGGREIRVRTYQLFLDEFPTRIKIERDPVASVSEVARIVSGTYVPVPSSDYYLKPGQFGSEVLLQADSDWPTDQDAVEHAVRVTFVTTAHPLSDIAHAAIRRHVAFLYEHRGDCDPSASRNSLIASGAHGILKPMSIRPV